MRDRVVDGATLREIRKARGLTQTKLAELAGVSLSYIKYVETGTSQPSDPYANVIAEALGCAVEAFSTPKEAAA